MSQIVRDTGLTAADVWALADDRSTWRVGATTHSRLRAGVSKRVSESSGRQPSENEDLTFINENRLA